MVEAGGAGRGGLAGVISGLVQDDVIALSECHGQTVGTL